MPKQILMISMILIGTFLSPVGLKASPGVAVAAYGGFSFDVACDYWIHYTGQGVHHYHSRSHVGAFGSLVLPGNKLLLNLEYCRQFNIDWIRWSNDDPEPGDHWNNFDTLFLNLHWAPRSFERLNLFFIAGTGVRTDELKLTAKGGLGVRIPLYRKTNMINLIAMATIASDFKQHQYVPNYLSTSIGLELMSIR